MTTATAAAALPSVLRGACDDTAEADRQSTRVTDDRVASPTATDSPQSSTRGDGDRSCSESPAPPAAATAAATPVTAVEADAAAMSKDASAAQSPASAEGKSLVSDAAAAGLSLVAATAAAAATVTAAATPNATAAAAGTGPAVTATGELIAGGYQRGGYANDPTTGYYDEVEIEDMEWDPVLEQFTYPCPCGDKFRITKEELMEGEDIARCPSCSLLIKVIYDPADLEDED